MGMGTKIFLHVLYALKNFKKRQLLVDETE